MAQQEVPVDKVEKLMDMPELILAVDSTITCLGHDHYNPRYVQETVLSSESVDGEWVIGHEALELSSPSIRPVSRGKVKDWTMFMKFIHECFLQSHLWQAKKQTKILLVIPSYWTIEDIQIYVKELFSAPIYAGAIAILNAAVASHLFASGNSNKEILLDVGTENCTCSTINQGKYVAGKMLPVGLNDVIRSIGKNPDSEEKKSSYYYDNIPHVDDPSFSILYSENNIIKMVCELVASHFDEGEVIKVRFSGQAKDRTDVISKIEYLLENELAGRNVSVLGAPGANGHWLGAQIYYSNCITPAEFILREEFESNPDLLVKLWENNKISS